MITRQRFRSYPVTVYVSQSRTLLSVDRDAKSLESQEKATDETPPRWPSSVFLSLPVSTSQSSILPWPDFDADAKVLASREKINELDPRLPVVCILFCFASVVSRRRMLPLSPADTSVLESGGTANTAVLP